MAHIETPRSVDEFRAIVDTIEARVNYTRPAAFALGLATIEESRIDGEVKAETLDAQFTVRNYGANFGTAAVLAHALGQEETGLQTGEYELGPVEILRATNMFRPFLGSPGHANIDALGHLQLVLGGVSPAGGDALLSNLKKPVLSVVSAWEDAPVSVSDTYLRLYAMSDRAMKPNTINLESIFRKLPNVVITEQSGVYTPEKWNEIVDLLVYRGLSTAVRVVDKFPRMVDHVVPSGVRVADPSRVRLGAYLGEGTTVMHEGFANLNSGTEGPNMVEGRISQGVFVGRNSDIGGGSSTQGTLSGGGKERVSIGEDCLLEANSGVGISLGNDCRVEAGAYVKSTTPVRLPDGSVVKASVLSGQSNMLLRRNAQTGIVEMVPNKGGEWGGLNADLHSKQ